MSVDTQFGSLLVGLHEERAPQDILDFVVAVVAQVIDAHGAASVLLRDHEHVQLASFSDDVAQRAAMWQLELEGGPCMAAMRAGTEVQIANTTTDERWPRWAAAASSVGVRSSISVPLASGDPRSIGSLFVYSHRVNGFDDEDAATIRILGAHAAIAVRQVRHEAALERAIDSRTLIGQAEGILMAKYAINADQAFAALTRCSQATNRKLRVIAQLVIDEGDLPRA